MAAQPSLLLFKKLSASDLSASVLRTGRIVLPRCMMEKSLPAIVRIGCSDPRACPELPVSQACYTLHAEDDAGRVWPVLLKQWTAASGPAPRPIFVLERTADCMKANKATPGCGLRLAEDAGRLRLSVLRPAAANAVAAGGAAGGALPAATTAAAAAAAEGAAAAACDQAALLGPCGRSAGCGKGRGHPGFCTGQQSFRASPRRSSSASAASAYSPAAAHPQWVSVACGAARGDLHVPTLRVVPVDARGRAGAALSLAEFERSGGLGRYKKPPASVMVAGPGGVQVALGRWLAGGGGGGAPGGGRASPPVGGGGADSESDEDVAIAASQTLMSLSRSSSAGGGLSAGSARDAGRPSPSPPSPLSPAPGAHAPARPTPTRPTQYAAAALYARVCAAQAGAPPAAVAHPAAAQVATTAALAAAGRVHARGIV